MKVLLTSLFVVICGPLASWAMGLKPRSEGLRLPIIDQPVVDEAGILSPAKVDGLNSTLQKVNAADLVQLQVLVLRDLRELSIEELSIKIVDDLKMGKRGKDNGVLFLIIPSERKMRIEVGRGLEGAIPDVIAKRIIDESVAPFFRKGDFDGGVSSGVIEILLRADAESGGETLRALIQKSNLSYLKRVNQPELSGWSLLLFLLLPFLILLLKAFVSSAGFAGGHSGRHYGSWGGGSWGPPSGGGSGWGGGGGGFGGGGASGGW